MEWIALVTLIIGIPSAITALQSINWTLTLNNMTWTGFWTPLLNMIGTWGMIALWWVMFFEYRKLIKRVERESTASRNKASHAHSLFLKVQNKIEFTPAERQEWDSKLNDLIR